MAVSDILYEIEDLIASSKHVMFTNKCLIEEIDLIRLIDDLKSELPNELKRAAEIVGERDNMLARAQEEADRIVGEAKAYANKIVEESAVKQEADARARQIVEQALAQEKEIKERTMKDAYQLQENADNYANSVFDNLIGNVGSALNILEQAKKELNRGRTASRMEE